MSEVVHQIKNFDKYPGSTQLFWNGSQSKKTFIGGIIGLIFIFTTLALVIFKTIGIINKNQFALDSFIRRDMSKISILPNQIYLYITFVDFQTQTIEVIDPDQLHSFGLAAYVIQFEAEMKPDNQKSFNSFKSSNITQVQMKKCQGKDKESFFCAPGINYQVMCNFEAIDNGICSHAKQYHIQIAKCQPSIHKDCSRVVKSGLLPSLAVLDTKYNINDLNTSGIFEKGFIIANGLLSGAFIQQDQQYVLRVPISKLQIQLQQSIMPRVLEIFEETNKTETYFYPVEQIRIDLSYFQIYPAYFQFYLYRSGFTESYRRYFPRFDSMLGQVFGLMGLISLFFSLLCSGYNNWLMEKHIQESLGDPSEAPRKKTYFHYIKQMIQSTKNSCCHKQDKNQTLQSELTQLKQSNSNQIDIIAIHKNVKQLDEQNKQKEQKIEELWKELKRLKEKVQENENALKKIS